MSDPSTRVTAPHDPKGRLISIFVGAVLLPSLALSYVSVEFVPQLAKANKEMGFKRAANTLADIEKDLARAAQAKALEAAQAVGWERLLELGSHQEAKRKGELRTEGKQYVVREGDVINVLFNV